MARPNRKFSLLTEQPQPIPDDEDDPNTNPTAPTLSDAAPPQSAQPAKPTSSRPTRPTKPAAESPRAATTIRLHAPAAQALNDAWLNERRTRDPKLSYPEFASMIVQRGLAAYDKP